MIESMWDKGKEIADNAQTILKERLFSPIYFYFIIAWILTNRKFLYVLLFVDQQYYLWTKLQYMVSLYSFESFRVGLRSICELLIIPVVAALIAARPLAWVWELFFERYEQNKLNQISIKRKLDYDAKVKEAKNQREIRDLESDKKEIQYMDNDDFNDRFDAEQGVVEVAGYKYTPSEVLYNTDYEAYKDMLQDYKVGIEADLYQQQQEEIRKGK